MINLLPPETKKQIRAARMNVVLVNYCVLVCCTALALAAVFGVGFWADMNDQAVAQQTKDASVTAASAYAKTRTQAEAFAKDLATAKTILASNVSFSQLILDIASTVPSGVILNNLSLGANAKNTPIDINGRARTSAAAVDLKNSLEESPIFENVSITNVSQTDLTVITDPDPLLIKYPYIVSLKAQFSKAPATTGAGS
jgi:Tfp pilus assembly protein PilN